MSADDTATNSGKPAGGRWPRFGLSGKLLLLTTLFVMIAEIMIYVPSIANFRIMWLNDRLASAHTAALVLDAAPRESVPDSLVQQLLDSIGAKAVVMKMDNTRRMLARNDFMPDEIDQLVDVRNVSAYQAIVDAFMTLATNDNNKLIRALGPAPHGGDFLEIVVAEGPLRKAMWVYSRNILFVSLAISIFTAALVYFALHFMFVRPMHRITRNMTEFRREPENPNRIIAPSPSANRHFPMARRRSRRRTASGFRSRRWSRRCATRSSCSPSLRSAGFSRSSAS